MSETSVLTQEHHARLIADKENIARQAGVPVAMLSQSAKPYLGQTELEWLVHFRAYRRQNRGLVLVGKHTPPPEIKMMAMAAALLRNYVDAKVITLQSLIDAHMVLEKQGGEMPDPTVLFIPNLFVRQGGKGFPSFKMQIIYDLLISRFTSGKLTVAYVDNMDAMGSEYGHLFSSHLDTQYLVAAP